MSLEDAMALIALAQEGDEDVDPLWLDLAYTTVAEIMSDFG